MQTAPEQIVVRLTADQAEALLSVSGEGMAIFDLPTAAGGFRFGRRWRQAAAARAALKAAIGPPRSLKPTAGDDNA